MSNIKENLKVSHPTLDASHLKEYRHSGCILSQITVLLGIGKEVHLLDDEASGAALIEQKLREFFSKIYHSKAQDPDLFLPPQFTPAGILMAASHLLEKKESYTEAEKFIKNHSGILILEVSDVYFYRPENSWTVQCWILDTDHLDHTSIDYYIKNGLTADLPQAEPISDKAETTCASEKQHIIRTDENGFAWDDDIFFIGEPYEEIIVETDPFSID